jgi:hypothetical protein
MSSSDVPMEAMMMESDVLLTERHPIYTFHANGQMYQNISKHPIEQFPYQTRKKSISEL